MVVSGFSLFDLRKLYIDELFAFHEELIYTLEQKGELKEGAYDKIVRSNRGRSTRVEDTVDSLRRQMLKIVTNKGKKK